MLKKSSWPRVNWGGW